MFQRIAFIHYCTQNLERALQFYRDTLGLKLLVQNEEWVEFEVGGQRLALRLVDPWAARTEPPNSNGAMIWMEALPIEQAIAHLKKNKVKFINKLQVLSYGKTAIFADPDGNLIGLYEPPSKE
jgi:catechol 2,3-dioxygenase-like lactoylglutathione lyase family enzyme